MFERLLSGTAASIPPPALPNTELHTAQNLERELRAKLKVGIRRLKYLLDLFFSLCFFNGI